MGIRKVLGASVAGIVALLSKDFVKLVSLAIVIASPIAWYGIDKWLQNYPYRTAINWWVFAAAGLGAIGDHTLHRKLSDHEGGYGRSREDVEK